jgi:hypothetical protein
MKAGEEHRVPLCARAEQSRPFAERSKALGGKRAQPNASTLKSSTAQTQTSEQTPATSLLESLGAAGMEILHEPGRAFILPMGGP